MSNRKRKEEMPDLSSSAKQQHTENGAPSKSAMDEDELQFEDEYEEELEDEEIVDAGGMEESDEEGEAVIKEIPESERKDLKMDDEDESKEKKQKRLVWRPEDGFDEKTEQLDYDSTAYTCLHRLNVEWPALSFDIIKDHLGDFRSKFPHTCYIVSGTQAEKVQNNKITIMKLSDLHKTKHDDDDDEDSSDDEEEQATNTDKKDKEDSDDEGDDDPILEERSIKHPGGVNRIRCMPQHPHIIATWSDEIKNVKGHRRGQVFFWDAKQALYSLDKQLVSSFVNSSSSSSSSSSSASPFSISQQQYQQLSQQVPQTLLTVKPLAVQQQHEDEGFALCWSNFTVGRVFTGDCKNKLMMNQLKPNGEVVVEASFVGHAKSVEDIQASPSEENVFASCSADRTVRIWDVRAPAKSVAWVAAHKSDVNVISWNINKQASHLLVSGGDDGVVKVWDLRMFKSTSPAASFSYHKKPITSIEWHPHEESVFAASSEDNRVSVWDLGLEPDEEPGKGAEIQEQLPPQLYFIHAGQQEIKELHWHPQIASMCITTAGDGINVFKPSNFE